MVPVVKKLARVCTLSYPLVTVLRGVCPCMSPRPYMATRGDAQAVDNLMGETLVSCVLSACRADRRRREQRRCIRVAFTRGERL